MSTPTDDSMTRFACPTCSRRLKASSESAGKVVRCAKCGQAVTVPRSADDPPVAADDGPADEVQWKPEEITPSPPPGKPSRRERRERDDGVPIRTRPATVFRSRPVPRGQSVVRWGLVAGVIGVALAVPVAVVVSQYSPMFGDWLILIAEPFSPARLSQIPVHLLAFGLLFGAGGGLVVAALRYLSLPADDPRRG